MKKEEKCYDRNVYYVVTFHIPLRLKKIQIQANSTFKEEFREQISIASKRRLTSYRVTFACRIRQRMALHIGEVTKHERLGGRVSRRMF